MSLLDLLGRGSQGLLDFAGRLGAPQLSVDPQLEELAGGDASGARDAARKSKLAAMIAANQRGLPWYALTTVGDAAAQEAYEKQLLGTVEIADKLRTRRDLEDQKERLNKAIEKYAAPREDGKRPVLSPELAELARALPPDQQAELLAKVTEARAMAGKPVPVNDGYVTWDPDTNEVKFVRTYTDRPQSLGRTVSLDQTGVDDATIDVLAQQYLQTRTFPPGLTKIPGLTVAIVQRAQEIGASAGMDPAQLQALITGRKLDTHAIQKVNDMYRVTEAAEVTLSHHLDTVVNLANKVNASGVPVIDRWIQAGRKSVAGDPDVAAFHTAYVEAKNEYMKLISGAAGSVAGLTEGAREEGDRVFFPGATRDQIIAIARTARELAHAKKVAVEQQRNAFLSGLVNPSLPPAAGGPAAPAAPANRPPLESFYRK